VRRLRCTECGYRWNQSATEAQLDEGRKSTPLLDMLEPTMDMEAPAAVDIVEDTDDLGAGVIAAELNPDSADRAFEDIDAALSPLPAPTRDEAIEEAGRRWQWGLGIVAAALIMSGLVLGREAVVSAAPFTQSIYRGLGLEPWGQLREWDVCVAGSTADEIKYDVTNTSSFRRPLPDLFVTDNTQALVQLQAPEASFRSGETRRVAAPLDGLAAQAPISLTLAVKSDQSDGRSFGAC